MTFGEKVQQVLNVVCVICVVNTVFLYTFNFYSEAVKDPSDNINRFIKGFFLSVSEMPLLMNGKKAESNRVGNMLFLLMR